MHITDKRLDLDFSLSVPSVPKFNSLVHSLFVCGNQYLYNIHAKADCSPT